ncbi:hypothetical protein FHR87_003488 [Azomonas macrocytogenes]|uniref:Uncharacterized protein n=1 Tax=Azomonas macrocytogenes TaxID=69962 RepID=A0A839TA66_AZOMA|nr:hypothetical protein [Azomonas macrocytogenes]
MLVTSKFLNFIVFNSINRSNSFIYNTLHTGLSKKPSVSSGEGFWYPLPEELK